MENREYHVQKNEDIEHQYVKVYCTTNQFPPLKICGPHNEQHGVNGLSKNDQMRFFLKLDMSHVQYITLLVCILNEHLRYTNPGLQVCHHIFNHAIKLLKTSYTVLC